MLLCALFVLCHLFGKFYTVSGASCGCSSLVIPVHVDVLVPKDPMDDLAGLESNASDLRRVDDTYDIHGVFCRPDGGSPQDPSWLQLFMPHHELNLVSQALSNFLCMGSRTQASTGRPQRKNSRTTPMQPSPVHAGCPPSPSIGPALG